MHLQIQFVLVNRVEEVDFQEVEQWLLLELIQFPLLKKLMEQNPGDVDLAVRCLERILGAAGR